MNNTPLLTSILEALGDDCRTTDAIARAIDKPENLVLAVCRRAARDGKLALVSYGWNHRLAWASIETYKQDIRPFECAQSPSDRPEWYMTSRDRTFELMGD